MRVKKSSPNCPHYIAESVLSNLKKYLNDKAFYSVEEYRNSFNILSDKRPG